MHGDQPDLDDDDGVPRVDYVDCERDGRLARYAAAVRRTPGNDRHQTRTHVGSSLSQNVSDLPSTAWEIADSSKLLLPPFGTLWPHDEDPIAPTHECEVLRDEMPSQTASRAQRGWVPECVTNFNARFGKRLQQNQQRRRRFRTPTKPPVVL